MKPKYIICLILLCAIMLTGYIIAYNVSYRINYIPESKKQSEDSSKDSISNNENQTQNSDSQANVKADTGIDITVKKNMEYVLEKYYLDDYSLVEEKRKIPTELIGNSREQVIKYLKEYSESPSIDDIKEGIISYELIAFTNEKMILRKTYKKPETVYEYYLKAENDYITIYYIDKKTVYDYTSICVDSLPKAVKMEVTKGKYIETIVDLYDFLESYSS